jgi:hypothetical protein
VLFLHSLFYSGFFEDPLTWGVLAFAATALAVPGSRRPAEATPEGLEQPRDDGALGAPAEEVDDAHREGSLPGRVVPHLSGAPGPEDIRNPG